MIPRQGDRRRRAAVRPSWAARVEELERRWLLAVDFSIAAMSDTQYTVESFASPSTFARQTGWVAAHKNDPAYNFAFLTHQGDMLRRGYSDFQAGVAADALQKLDDAAIPYAVAIGNHDYDNQFDDLDHHVSSANFAKYFGDARYAPQRDVAHTLSEYGSSLDQRNHYHVFTAGPGGQRFLVLSLEWQIPTAARQWGQSVIDAHPQLPVILITHEYLSGSAGSRTTATPVDAAAIGAQNGESIYNNFVSPNPQIFMVVSGHTGATWNRAVTTSLGQTVYEVAADFEGSKPNGGDGWLETLRFDLGDPSTGRLGSLTITQVQPTSDTTQQVGASTTYANIDFAKRFTFAPRAVPAPVDPGASPVAVSQAVSTPEGRMVAIDPRAGASDADDAVSGLRPILKSLPAHGAVYVRTDGTLEYTPDQDPGHLYASDSFDYVLSDGKSNSGAATVTVNLRPAAPVFSYPIAESTVVGNRTGSRADLTASDGVVEKVTEVISSGTDVDQRWTFNVTPGANTTDPSNLILAINAWRSFSNPGTGDEYHLAYSTNNSTWTDLTRLVPNSSKDVTRTRSDAGEPYQFWALPPTLSGTVYIRATDVNTSGTETADTLSVDEIFIRSAVAFPNVSVSATSGAESTANDRPVTFTFTRSGSGASVRDPLAVRFALTGTATPGDDYGPASADGTYSVTIPAGAASAQFSLTPVADDVLDDAETVIATVLADNAYDVGGASEATGTIADLSVDSTPPTAPVLSSTGTTASTASLSWTASADDVGVAGYDVYRGGVLIGSVDPSVTTLVDSGLTEATAYSYSVRARDAAGNTAASNTVAATTRPAAPTGLTGTKTAKRVKLTWQDNSARESGFYVYSSRDGVTWTRMTTVAALAGSGGTAAFTTGTLASGRWYFKVTAFVASAESDASNIFSITV
jgi:hypothetical protein